MKGEALRGRLKRIQELAEKPGEYTGPVFDEIWALAASCLATIDFDRQKIRRVAASARGRAVSAKFTIDDAIAEIEARRPKSRRAITRTQEERDDV